MTVDEKECTKCKVVKKAEEFCKQTGRKSGLSSHCKQCRNTNPRTKEYTKIYGKEYYKNNTDKRKKYLEDNKELLKERRKERNSRDEIKKKQLEYAKHYRITNKDKIDANKDKYKEYMKNYYIKNKDKLREQKHIYDKNRMETDINYRVTKNLRGRVRSALKNNWKSANTMELIGCDIETLKMHIEAEFDDKMSWDNYGSYWHIDHIKPCASFNMSDPEQQKLCFNWSNLQPLEAVENLKKGAKINWKKGE